MHPSIIELKNRIDNGPKDKKYEIDLTYITSRGGWYHISWKGDHSKSGGIATNIGIHFFDMLTWIFGDVQENEIYLRKEDKASGFLELKNARVRWFLSIDENDLPVDIKAKGQRTFRSIQINNEEIEFSEGFTELHTKSYREILAGNGFGLDSARPSVNIVHHLRNASIKTNGSFHPFLNTIV